MHVRTLVDLYRHALIDHPKPDAFRVKREGSYRDVSSGEFLDAGSAVAAGLRALGLGPGTRVAIMAETRLEWAQADFAVATSGMVSVPVYPTLAASTVLHILRDSGASALLASNASQAAKAEGIRADRPGFPIVIMDGDGGPGNWMTWERLLESGRTAGASPFDGPSPEPGDLATLIYTSGTTGPPKGVMLTHGNLASNAELSLSRIPLRPEDVCLSFLPLSHVFERTGGYYCMLLAGAGIAYAESMDTVVENLREVRPTVLLSVPRLYEKMYARIMESAVKGGPLRRTVFHWARGIGLARSRKILAGEAPGFALEWAYRVADPLLYAKMRARFGGRLRFFVSGGAPLSPEIAAFFHGAGLPILEGYGLTETSPVVALNTLEDQRPGTVGKPIPETEVTFAEDGEILVRGPGVMQGYYNLPEATAEAMEGGWFHTGDIGHLDEDGFLVITDRKKDLIVTAGGKKVPPQPVENLLKTDRFISEAVVLGDKRPFLVALIVPDFDQLTTYARHKGIRFDSPAELARNREIRDFLVRRVAKHQEGAAPFETIKKIHVLERPLEPGAELTPTMKVKRKELLRRFEREIAALYES